MKKDHLFIAIILLSPFVAWIFGVLDLDRVGIILIGIVVVLFVTGLLSHFGRSIPHGDISYFYPIQTASHVVVLSLIVVAVGFLLFWLF